LQLIGEFRTRKRNNQSRNTLRRFGNFFSDARSREACSSSHRDAMKAGKNCNRIVTKKGFVLGQLDSRQIARPSRAVPCSEPGRSGKMTRPARAIRAPFSSQSLMSRRSSHGCHTAWQSHRCNLSERIARVRSGGGYRRRLNAPLQRMPRTYLELVSCSLRQRNVASPHIDSIRALARTPSPGHGGCRVRQSNGRGSQSRVCGSEFSARG
jgi:hypothetical protein